MSRTKNTIINTLTNCTAKTIQLVSSFILRTIFIYYLGAEYNGLASLFRDFLMVLSFAELGISSAITYALYRPLQEQNYKRISQLLGFYKRAYRIVAISIALIGVGFVPFLDYIVVGISDIEENLVLIYILYLINTVISYLNIYKSTFLIAQQKKYIVTNIEMIITVVRTVLQCAFLMLTKEFIVYLLVQIVATFVQNHAISRKVDKLHPDLEIYKEKMNIADSKKLLMDIKALAMYKISGAILIGIDSIVISITSGTVFVGYVANYKMIIKGIDSLLNQFFIAIEPSVGNLATETDDSKQYAVFKMMNLIAFWIACFFSAAFIALLNPFIGIWIGSQHSLEVETIILLVIDFYLVMMIRPVASYRMGNGLFVQGQYRPVIMAVLNITLSIVFGIYLGVAGVLLATVASRVLTQVWYDPYLVFSNVFHISAKEYWNDYFYLIAVTVGTCFITYSFTGMIHFEAVYVDFIVKLLVSCMVANICICISIGWKKESKELFKVLIKQYDSFRRHA